jgi:hypothetical protein
VGCAAQFDGTTSYDQDEEGESIQHWYWYYGDGSGWNDDGAEPSHVYDTAGTYWVWLYVVDDEATESLPEDDDYCCVYVVEVEKVEAGGKETGQTLYRANDYLDEPDKKTELSQSVQATLNPDVTTPESFYWTPRGSSPTLPRIDPNESTSATFYAKDHDNYTITAHCGTSSKSMNIAVEGVDIATASISAADETTESYNIFRNDNFDQQLNPTSTAGHTTCYDPDHTDDSLAGDSSDEIGTITLTTETYGDSQAEVKFEVSSAIIKLYKSESEKLEFGTYYLASSLPGSLKVEGTSTGSTILTATIKTQDNYTATDQLKIRVVPLNLAAFDPWVNSAHEICNAEDLIIRLNNNDSDNDDIIDLLDPTIAGGDPDIAKICLAKPSGIDDSDISGSITMTFPANVNAFKNNDKTGGSAPTSYSLSDLPADIFLEGKNMSSDTLDTQVKVTMTLDSGVVCRDEILYTVINILVSKCSDTWLPTQGGSTNITGTLDPPISEVSKTHNFALNASSENGYCCNMGTQTDKDLQFQAQTGFTISGANNEFAERTSTSGSETVQVDSFDYGSYGKIEYKVTIGSRTFIGHIPGNPLQEFARIPRDDDENDIADAWPHNAGNKTDDTDNTPGGANNGDGLSRYEEYRGFFIGGSHIRTEADTKDLFIYDQHGIGFGNAGALGFTLRSINSNEWSGTSGRRINHKQDNDQCGIWLRDGGANGQGILGLCFLGTPNGGDDPIVYVQEILNLGGTQANVDKTIAHEIGHDVDIVGDHGTPPNCMMNQGLLIRTSYCTTCLSQRKLH